MALGLAGKQTNAWAAPTKIPADFTPAAITIGRDVAAMGLEVAQAEWSGRGAPSREAMSALQAARLNKRLCPVVVVAEGCGQAWLFGPNAQGQVMGSLAENQAERLLQAAVDQSSGLLARQRLTDL